MKVIIGIICITLCTFVGYFLSDKYVKRKELFGDFVNFNKTLLSEINFSKSSVLKIINDFPSKNGDFYNTIKSIYTDEKTKFNYCYLTSEEKEFANKYFNSIVGIDDKTLANFINASSKKLGDIYNETILEEKKYRTLYVKIGFLIGLIIFIVLI